VTAGAAVRPTPQTSAPTPPGEVRLIPLTELFESPWNPRKHFDPAKLRETAESLRVSGQLTPITVRPWTHKERGDKVATPYYEIGAGHRRFRAAPLAGLTSLLAVVRPLDDVAFLELLTIENKQREDVTPLDEAAGFRMLMEKAGYDVAKLAARIGLSMKYVYDRLKLLQLRPEARKLLEDGTITPGHAILLARLSPTDQQRAIGNRTRSWHGIDGGLFETEDADGLDLKDAVKPRSVRELQQWIHDNVRMKPETVDPFLFPETVQVLAEAKETKDKVVHITYEYRVPDGARDPNEKTYGKDGWKRADGRERSKKCDRSVIGHVVAGPHQGDAFRVCVNKNRCKVHWKEQATAYERREKAAKAEAKRQRTAAASGKARKAPAPSERERAQAAVNREATEEAAREVERLRWDKATPALLQALADRIENWGQPGATSQIGKYILKHTDAVAGRSRNLEKVMKPGRSADDFVRYIAFVNAGAQVKNAYDADDITAELQLFGLDAQKIVDRVAPKPTSEKKQPAKKPAKKKAKKKGGR